MSNSTPGSWSIGFYVSYDSTQGLNTYLEFLPTGELDTELTPSANLKAANVLVNETINYPIWGIPTDYWRLINWIIVSDYWLTLYDLGQTSAILSYAAAPPLRFNLSAPIIQNETYNIFVNDTLFKSYSSFLLTEILPYWASGLPFPSNDAAANIEIQSLSESNHLKPIPTPLYRTYSCSQREMKEWFSLLISVFAADYAIIGGTYSIFLGVAGWIQGRRDARECYL